MKTSKLVPTASELEILKVIWRRGAATVREVFGDLSQEREVAYTTVLTMIGILVRKKYLTRHMGGRVSVYSPVLTKEKILHNMVDEFVSRVYDGSAQTLLTHLVDDPRLDYGDLAAIKGLIQNRLKGKIC